MSSNLSLKSLAVKYRPDNFDQVCEQGSVVKILNYMLENNCWPNTMLFCGSAGTGKTTCARIMANKINNGSGSPIEIDAASNNSVDNIRKIIDDSKFKALDAEYKVYILDEVHMLSIGAFNATLKLFEDPPAKTIYILCTTDPQKVPATILSRIQRFDFNRITFKSIVERLLYIIEEEKKLGRNISYEMPAIEYIAKMAEGGMRDAITNMDKALNYSEALTTKTVVEALGAQDYETLFLLTDKLISKQATEVIDIIENVYLSGRDLKLFMKQYILFLLDLCKYYLTKNFNYIQIPSTYKQQIEKYSKTTFGFINELRNRMIRLSVDIKWESSPKVLIESELLAICFGGE